MPKRKKPNNDDQPVNGKRLTKGEWVALSIAVLSFLRPIVEFAIACLQ
jgi:hypothetical protein